MNRVLPILFNTDMVRAILDGLKGVTRRLGSWKIAKFNVDRNGTVTATVFKETKRGKKVSNFAGGTMEEFIKTFSDYQPGDTMYVRETWSELSFGYVYKADGENIDHLGNIIRWRPSIHMPKEAARIWLKVKDVRVERLQEITEIQTEEEGLNLTPPCLHQVSEDSYCDLDGPCTSKIKYCDMSAGEYFGKVLWDSTIKKSNIDRYGWDANPWVWVIEFERIEVN